MTASARIGIAPTSVQAASQAASPAATPAAAPVGFQLEPGERILWQGRPTPVALRRHLFRMRWIAGYFAALLAWKIALIAGVRGLQPQEVADAVMLVVQGAALAGILSYFAWAIARGTTYTLTDLRIVVHHGVALPGTVDIPLRAVRSVAVRVHADGTGDVALGIRDGGGVGYAKLWPHVRGLALAHPVPMLRGLPEAAVLATMLTRRLDGMHAPAHLPEAPRAAITERAA